MTEEAGLGTEGNEGNEEDQKELARTPITGGSRAIRCLRSVHLACVYMS